MVRSIKCIFGVPCFPFKTKQKGRPFCLEHSMMLIAADLQIISEAKSKKHIIVGRTWAPCCVTFGKALNFSRPYFLKYTADMSDASQNPCFLLLSRYTTILYFLTSFAIKCGHVTESSSIKCEHR